MRLFIAVNFPDKIKQEIADVIEKQFMQFPQIKWTKKENLHLTLKFLGETEIKSGVKIPMTSINRQKQNINIQKNQILDNIKEGVYKSISEIKSFELAFDKIGYFDNREFIIWLGIKLHTELFYLVSIIEKEMSRIGFPKEKRNYNAHVTLGRGKRMENQKKIKLKDFIVNKSVCLPSQFSVSCISLIQSVLTRNGPIYSEIERFNFVGS